jgi:hypothetical protein
VLTCDSRKLQETGGGERGRDTQSTLHKTNKHTTGAMVEGVPVWGRKTVIFGYLHWAASIPVTLTLCYPAFISRLCPSPPRR